MGRSRDALRLFVAVYPPPEVAERLVAAMEAALAELDAPEHRGTPITQVHLTMQFIGDVEARRLDEIIESVTRSVRGLPATSLTPQRLITLPPRGPARLVAAEADAPPTLRELKQRLVTRLARTPRESSGRTFLPHLTLCRFRAPLPRLAVRRDLAPVAFPVAGVALVRSVLHADGARHASVEEFPLAGC